MWIFDYRYQSKSPTEPILVYIYTFELIFGLQTKSEVKMAGYWPSFYIAFLWTESRSINSQQYRVILTEQAWSIKDLLYDFWGNFSRRKQWVVPSGQDSSILPTQVANHSAGFDSSCLLEHRATMGDKSSWDSSLNRVLIAAYHLFYFKSGLYWEPIPLPLFNVVQERGKF